MELKYFKTPQGQWLEFRKDDVTFDRYFESALRALDGAFSAQNFIPEQAKKYLQKILKFAQCYPDNKPHLSNDWYEPSVDKKFLGERAPTEDGKYTAPLRDFLSRYNGPGLSQVAKIGLHLLKDIDGGIEAKVVQNPTGIACECPH